MKNGIVIRYGDCEGCPRQAVPGKSLCSLCEVMHFVLAIVGYPAAPEGA